MLSDNDRSDLLALAERRLERDAQTRARRLVEASPEARQYHADMAALSEQLAAAGEMMPGGALGAPGVQEIQRLSRTIASRALSRRRRRHLMAAAVVVLIAIPTSLLLMKLRQSRPIGRVELFAMGRLGPASGSIGGRDITAGGQPVVTQNELALIDLAAVARGAVRPYSHVDVDRRGLRLVSGELYIHSDGVRVQVGGSDGFCQGVALFAAEGGQTRITVYEGQVSLSAYGTTVLIRAGESLSPQAGESLLPAVRPSWVIAAESLLAQKASR